MISEVEMRELAGEFPLFAHAPATVLEMIRGAAAVVEVPSGATLFDAGSPCKAFPLLLRGCVRVTKLSSSGREMVLYRIVPGQLCLLTSSCLLGQAVYPAHGFAEEDTRILVMEPALFHRLLAEYEEFRKQVFGLFAERLVEMMQLVEAVAFGRLDKRLAALLMGRGGMVRASHQSLADELGSVRVVVSRILRNFEEKGWVALGREQIEILKPKELLEFMEEPE